MPGQDINNPFFARLYDRVLHRGEESDEMLQCRRRALEGLRGRVVEVGPGNGPNFPLYPEDVEAVIAVEPEPYLRTKAETAAASTDDRIRVTGGTADALPVEDHSVDVVVFAHVLCSVEDQGAALAEARRVLRPGGELRLFEHVVATQPIARAAQKAVEATFWPRAFGNCHPARDTLGAVGAAGFDTSEVQRFVLRPGGMVPPLPHILGRAPMR